MGLKEKTISGMTWSFIDNISVQSLRFGIGIILARLLTPKQFGVIGMIAIFISVSSTFIDSGFTQAIIRKKDAEQRDYSTVFYFNIAISILFYLILFFLSPAISSFFNEPILTLIIKVLGLGLIVDALAIIQRARLTKQINFKLQTKISVISNLFSGGIGIFLALKGYGVWSLVAKMLFQKIFNTVLLWIWNRWKPTFEFSIISFKAMFAFGSKLLLSGLLNTIYQNAYYFIIGKFFSAAELGYYTRADQFKKLPSENITTVIQRVSYPVLASIQDDVKKLRDSYRRLIKSTMFLSFFLMINLAAVAKPLTIFLIGEKWMPSVIYLQLLCFSGLLYPLHAINLNMLNVQGRSDLFLKLEIIKKILAVPVIVVGVLYNITLMIIAMMINSFIAFFLNSYYSGKKIGYSSLDQLKDIYPSFLFSLFIGSIVFLLGFFLNYSYLTILLIQILASCTLFFSLSELFKFKEYKYLKKTIMDRVKAYHERKNICN